MPADVLIVDDKKTNRLLLRAQLDSMGLDLAEASGPGEALEFVQSEKPRLAIIDYMMPGMTGVELLRAFKRDINTTQVEGIGVSAMAADPSVEARWRLEGGHSFMFRPFVLADLQGAVRAVSSAAWRPYGECAKRLQNALDAKRIKRPFFSYADADLVQVLQTTRELEPKGFRCFVAERDCKEGDRLSMAEAIEACDGLVLFASDQSVQRDYVVGEVRHALDCDLPVVPALLNEGAPLAKVDVRLLVPKYVKLYEAIARGRLR